MGDSNGTKIESQTSQLAPFPTLRLQGPPHKAATLQRAWQAIALSLGERIGLSLASPVWRDGPECAVYCRGTRLARVQPESQSVGELTELVLSKAACLLSLSDTAGILAELERRSPVYAREMARLEIPASYVHAVLRLLLAERVSIADMETILDAVIAEWSPGRHAESILEKVRERLGPWLCETHAMDNDEIHALALAPKVEGYLTGKITAAHTLELESQAASRLLDAMHDSLLSQEAERPVLVSSSALRLPLARLLERGLPGLPVLGWNEISADYAVNVLVMLEHRF